MLLYVWFIFKAIPKSVFIFLLFFRNYIHLDITVTLMFINDQSFSANNMVFGPKQCLINARDSV